MSEEEGKIHQAAPAGDGDPHHHHQYGTFHSSPGHSEPAVGFPYPVPPPGLSGSPPPPAPSHYHHGYQAVPGYPVADERSSRQARLPCCGIGIGWILFITGFFLAAIPWYVGAFILLCVRVDYREKPGLIICTIAAVLATIAIIIGATKGADVW